MKSYIQQTVGKTIEHIVVTKRDDDPRFQVFFVFDDRTYFELYGADIHSGTRPRTGGLEEVIDYTDRFFPKERHIYPPNDKL